MMRAISTSFREDGMETVSLFAVFAFRIRVSMSAIESVVLIDSSYGSLMTALERFASTRDGRACFEAAQRLLGLALPACFADTGEFAFKGKFTQADSAQTELAIDRMGPAAAVATRVRARAELGLALCLGDHRFLCQCSSFPVRGRCASPAKLRLLRENAQQSNILPYCPTMPQTGIRKRREGPCPRRRSWRSSRT